MADEYKTCDICKDKTNSSNFDLLWFGDWQQSRDILVHYFCLLLSTNLPQRGKDCSGINGFLLRDIRKEIKAATKRPCCYCGRAHASIQCFKCREYFHILCARKNRCLLTFHGDFRSFCDECIPKKELQPTGLQTRPSSFERCSICREQMGLYNEIIFIFGKCCNKGYAHSVCVQKYALAAGYYLRCLWCRSAEFRDSVRQQGIFVPDRDARWEIQKETYTDLHRGHSTCNMDVCFCPKGRDFNRGKWSLILCSLCGSVGAHNPKCLLGKENAKEPVSEFKCATCAHTESTIAENRQKNVSAPENVGEVIDKSIFMTKTSNNHNEEDVISALPSFSDDDETQSSDSFITVIPQKNSKLNSSTSNCAAINPTIKGHNEIILSYSNKDISVDASKVILQKSVEPLLLVIDCSDEEKIDDEREKASSEKSAEPQMIEFDYSDESREKQTEQPPIESQDENISSVEDLRIEDGNIPRPIPSETEVYIDEDIEMESREKPVTPQPVASQAEALLFCNPPTPQPFDSQVTQTNSSNEEIGNIVSKPSTSRSIIFAVEDDETQLFEKSSADTTETRVVKNALFSQQSGSCDTQDEETQLFDVDVLDKQNTDKLKEVISKNYKELGNVTKSLATTTTTQCEDPTNEIACVHDTNLSDDVNQSPIVSSSQAEKNCEWLTFEVYEYDNNKNKCIGSAQIRINLCDERFAGLTLEQIEANSSNILSDGDIISRSDDIGIFAKIDEIISEYIK